MAAPTYRFQQIPISTADTALDTPGERKTAAGNGTNIDVAPSTTPLDFGTLDISATDATSASKLLSFDCTANGGNTTVNNMKLWIDSADWGFTQATTDLKYVNVSGGDYPAPSNCDYEYVANAVPGSYAVWADLDDVTTEPSQNVYAADDTASIDITTIGTSDDVALMQFYLFVPQAETTGTYQGNGDFQFSFKFDYS